MLQALGNQIAGDHRGRTPLRLARYQSFQQAILATPLTYERVLRYRGLGPDAAEITFFADRSRPPLVDGSRGNAMAQLDCRSSGRSGIAVWSFSEGRRQTVLDFNATGESDTTDEQRCRGIRMAAGLALTGFCWGG